MGKNNHLAEGAMHPFGKTVIAAVETAANKVRYPNQLARSNWALWLFLVVLTVCCGIVSTVPASAQTTSGTILGIVTDNSGAAVPGANVTLTNVDTEVKNTATSDGNGAYQFVNMPPGNYTVDIEKTGFAHQRSGPAALEVQGSLKFD